MPFPIIPAGTKSSGYTIAKSLRFRSSASAYLSRTYSGAPTSTTKQTFSAWVKRGAISSRKTLFSGYDGTSTYNTALEFTAADVLLLTFGGTTSGNVQTNQVFRDPSAWYHIVLVVDTTSATTTITGASTDRVRIYVNGVQISSFTTATVPSLNANLQFALANANNRVGSWWDSTLNFDGYLSEVNFIDGQALTPSDFGQTDTATGVWMPKKYTGTYGTNGFYLNFSDVGSTTAGGANTGYGKDFAGTNNWTTNNFNSTSTSTSYDSMIDTPTPYDDGGNGVGNYPVISPLDKNTNITVSNANLTAAADATTNWRSGAATFGSITSGKWYFEVTATSIGASSYVSAGWELTSANHTTQAGGVGGTASFNNFGVLISTTLRQTKANATVVGSDTNTNANGDVLMIAVDFDNSKGWVGKNGTWYDSGNPATGANAIATALSGGLSPAYQAYNGGTLAANFGQRPFTYTPPSGFKALNTQNLPTPTIGATSSTLANKYFDVNIWTGNGTSQTITNGGFQPDFIWIKDRSVASAHALTNTVVGITKYLESNTTVAETTDTTSVTAVNSNGFSLGAGTAAYYTNRNGEGFVGWQWKANGSGSSNTSGTITSTVSANVTAGFSVVTYTGTSTTGTVGHGLGVAPKMIVVKTRNAVADWYVYHASNGANKYMYMNLTNAVVSAAGYFDTVSSTVFGGTSAAGIISTSNFVAYCFAEVAGYSKFGSYTGNGSADGVFVYTGFRPRYLLVKASSAVEGWVVWDTARNTYNVAPNVLYPNGSNAETSTTSLDILSNGFKMRNAATNGNISGVTYIYAAFAESPFNYARAR